MGPVLGLFRLSCAGSLFVSGYRRILLTTRFLGTEIIATTLGEAENPRKTVPRAIKRVFYRLVVFYVLGIFIISVRPCCHH